MGFWGDDYKPLPRSLSLQDFVERNHNSIFVVMDTETTGLSAQDADVIEVSAIKARFENGKVKVLDTFDEFINPGYPLPDKIVEFNEKNGTCICDEFLADKPVAGKVANALQAFMEKEPKLEGSDKPYTLVGHNIEAFDVPFIQKLMKAGRGELQYGSTFDTLVYARSIIPYRGRGTHTLGVLHEKTPQRLFKEHPQYHNSLGDCLATLDLLETFAEKELAKYKEKEPEPAAAVPEPVREPAKTVRPVLRRVGASSVPPVKETSERER